VEIQLEVKKVKKLSVFTIVIALCLGAAAMIQSVRVADGWKSSSLAHRV